MHILTFVSEHCLLLSIKYCVFFSACINEFGQQTTWNKYLMFIMLTNSAKIDTTLNLREQNHAKLLLIFLFVK